MKIGKLLTRIFLGRRRADAMAAARIMRSPDRRVLMETYLPRLARDGGRILWIGCRAYTAGYPAILEREGAEVWTTDIDPRAGQWGRDGRHRTGDIRRADILFADLIFDAVACNGILGFGVNSVEDQRRTLNAIGAILRPGGLLLLGWNDDRIADPVAGGLLDPLYSPADFAGMPSRVGAGGTHIYDSFRRGVFS